MIWGSAWVDNKSSPQPELWARAKRQADLDGGVPSPLLGLSTGRFSWLGLIRLKFLLRHFHHSVFGFVQLGAFLSGPLLPPSYLQKRQNHFWFIFHSVKKFQIQSPHLHALDAAHSSPTIVGRVHRGPLLPRQPIVVVGVLGTTRSLQKNPKQPKLFVYLFNFPKTWSLCDVTKTKGDTTLHPWRQTQTVN